MRIEVDCSGRGTTHNVLKWKSSGHYIHVALLALVFCEEEAVVELSFDILRC